MYRPAHPQRVQDVAERLAAYFEDEPLVIHAKAVPRQGTYISVAHVENPSVGLLFHVDELDNGASGFKDQALLRIRAYLEGTEFVPAPIKPGLVYDDVITYGGSDLMPKREVPLE